MRKPITSIAFLILLVQPLALARALDPVPPPTIEVTGEGEVKIEPDQVVLRFGIENFGSKFADVQAENTKRTNALIDALKKAGVKNTNVQTTAIQVSPRYDFGKEKRKFLEYYARKNFTVTIDDVTNYGKVIAAAFDAGVEDVSGLEFRSSKEKVLRDEARKSAMADARRKADMMSGALGQSAGKATRITEMGGDMPPQPMFGRMMAMKADASAPDTVAPGEITVRSSVQVQFELK